MNDVKDYENCKKIYLKDYEKPVDNYALLIKNSFIQDFIKTKKNLICSMTLQEFEIELDFHYFINYYDNSKTYYEISQFFEIFAMDILNVFNYCINRVINEYKENLYNVNKNFRRFSI